MKSISPKHRRDFSNEDGQRYLMMLKETDRPWCWACGRGANDRSSGWFAPWILTLAHLAAGGSKMKRHINRRAVVIFCPLCHLLHSTSGEGSRKVNGTEYPQLSNGNVLWIKRSFDPEWFDLDWIAERWLGELPDLIPPNAWFIGQYRQRHPDDQIIAS